MSKQVNCPMSWGKTTTDMCMDCDKFIRILKVEDTLMVECCPQGNNGVAVIFEGGD